MFEKPYSSDGKHTKFGDLLPRPHCGSDDWDSLTFGYDEVSVAWWDSANRGLQYGFVKCYCGAMVLANDDEAAFKRWNERRNP